MKGQEYCVYSLGLKGACTPMKAVVYVFLSVLETLCLKGACTPMKAVVYVFLPVLETQSVSNNLKLSRF